MPDQMTRAEFAASIKAKYPAYAQVPDDELATRMLEKYPVYQSQIKADAPAKESTGYWEDLGGIAGKAWHPPAGAGSDRTRPDNSLLGLPPEMAVVSGLGIGRAMVGEGLSAAGRVYAGAKAAAEQATPVLKYEAAKAVLEGMHVPSAIAIPIAIAVSGYKKGAKAPAAAAEASAPAMVAAPNVPANATGTKWGYVSPASVAPEAAAAARVAPAASTPAAPASPVVTGASPSAPLPPAVSQWSPQRIRNEVGLAERRGGLKLTEVQREQADRLVAQGAAPAEAVTSVAAEAPAASAPTPTTAPPAPASAAAQKLHLNAAESKEYLRLRNAGKTHPEAQEAIEQQRTFARQFGTPSVEAVRKAVAERNATGRWQNDSWQKK